jgi:hypothetical protein
LATKLLFFFFNSNLATNLQNYHFVVAKWQQTIKFLVFHGQLSNEEKIATPFVPFLYPWVKNRGSKVVQKG